MTISTLGYSLSESTRVSHSPQKKRRETGFFGARPPVSKSPPLEDSLFVAYRCHQTKCKHLCAAGGAARGGYAAVVAVRQFPQRSALCAPSGGLFPLPEKGAAPSRSSGLGAVPAFGCPGADWIALNIGEASENGQHQTPRAGAGIGPRLGE